MRTQLRQRLKHLTDLLLKELRNGVALRPSFTQDPSGMWEPIEWTDSVAFRPCSTGLDGPVPSACRSVCT